MCDSCNFKFQSPSELSDHQKTHFCVICGIFLQKPYLMKNHMIKVHNYPKEKFVEKKKFCCQICKKLYSSAGSLYNHKKTTHNSSTCSCKTCGQVFKHKGQLSIHEVRHRSRKVFCSECSAKFYFISELNKHINQVHRKIRPYECPKCGKYFCQRSVLKHHLSQHIELQSGDSSIQSLEVCEDLHDKLERITNESPSVTFVLELHSPLKNVEISVSPLEDTLSLNGGMVTQ